MPSHLQEDASHESSTAEPAAPLTPRMDDAELRETSRLSLQHVRPPAKVAGYEQEQFLGRGAFGEVWKAIDSNSGRAVAIKFYSRRGGLDWSHMAREVEKLQHLFSDRYVVQLFGVGWDADPPYYVMEYMPYGSLEDRLRAGALSVADAVRIIRETARGLVHAHDKGILHCDLKPGNIMLDQDDRPRLADFGQARLKNDRAPSLGTLFYMAPEQADLTAAPDARWDVYALGTILYRMVTGRLPYEGEGLSRSVSTSGPVEERLRLYRELLRSAPPPTAHRRTPGVDRALAEIIDGCLQVDPMRRYRNVQSVLTALEARETRRRQRSFVLLGLLGPALVVGVMSAVAAYLFQQTMLTTQNELVARTLESDQFAAKTVASQFGAGLDKRWRILEQEASNPMLKRWLALERGDREASLAAEVAAWLQQRHAARNQEFTTNTTAAYWFVLDRKGILRGISPPNDALLGKYFGYREYFHGQGRELAPEQPPPEPVAQSHRSNVFRSQPTNRPAVAFSTPIWSDDGRSVLGIIAMETELGHFSDFAGSRKQFAVLVDLRPDASGQEGLIVEHPYFEQQLDRGRALEEFYLDPYQLATLQQLRKKRREALDSVPRTAAEPIVSEVHHDPIGGEFAGEWLAAFEPVFVYRGPKQMLDSGWTVIVEERRADILRPFEKIRSMIRRGGWWALGLVAFVIAVLWAVVLLIVSPPRSMRNNRLFKRIVGAQPSASAGSVGASSTRGSSRDKKA